MKSIDNDEVAHAEIHHVQTPVDQSMRGEQRWIGQVRDVAGCSTSSINNSHVLLVPRPVLLCTNGEKVLCLNKREDIDTSSNSEQDLSWDGLESEGPPSIFHMQSDEEL
jgi:hypothetical protein